MDAATAAIIGAAIGFGGTFATALISPLSTARHARAARRLELRRDSYAAASTTIQDVLESGAAEDRLRVAHAMVTRLTAMKLVTSPDVAKLYEVVAHASGHRHRRLKRPAHEPEGPRAGREQR